MVGFLITIHTLICILLVSVILMQASQGGGLSGTIGGGMTNTLFGGRGTATILSKMTVWFSIAFMLLALIIGLFSTSTEVQTESILKKEAEERVLDLSLPAAQELDEIE
ncbi:MAG TPA: preprotein translocase subunit SecG [Candidatus Marinimicrobia bacterium]|nr:preprotein translocase subunit SecG [Candidatus Neomarinimicrobiota bacterium]HJL73737.1 preprotein translocase subunit SecG [Candidatus Neomarinimicrobiota bacterium]HJM69730.1 preprotein translocase subunit SecG [Candidatus Neomarinimicrobiota bacterium]